MFLIIAVITFCLLAYVFNQHKHSYWSKLGFAQLDPKFFVGDVGLMIAPEKSLGEIIRDIYVKGKGHDAVGAYMSYQPILVPVDPVLIQNIMIKEFGRFHDRPVPVDMTSDKLQHHLFHLEGQRWRDLRVKLSPTFTSGKIKGMFPIIRDCGETLIDFMQKNVKNGNDVFEFRDLTARFSTNIISSVAFGIENDCINEPDHIFRKIAIKNMNPGWRLPYMMFMAMVCPYVLKVTKFKFTHPEVEEFIYSLVNQTVEYREKNNVQRNDFLQLLMHLKNQGYVAADKGEENVEKEIQKLNVDDFAAQCFVFFQAGSDTSSSTVSYTLYELAKNPEIQKKVQDEIDQVLGSRDVSEISYEDVNKMKFLECCMDEALRKYPIVPLLMRQCSEDYEIPDTKKVIPKGTMVMIPVLGLHRDPEIYDEPMKFRPERFLESSTGGGKVKGTYYLPFGDGPRNCIGMRLGKVTSKVCLAMILAKYTLEFSEKRSQNVDKELKFEARQFLLVASETFDFKVRQR